MNIKKIVWLMIIVALAALAITSVTPAADQDLAVVVNKSNSIDSLTKSQLRKLVLGQQGSWPGGEKVTVILGTPGTSERGGVLKSICRMSENDYNQHMMHASFSGETSGAPKVASSPAAVRQMVASYSGGIGFLRPSDVDASVKVVSVDGVLAGQPDYQVKAGM